MKIFLDLPDGFYAVKKNELYRIELPIAKFKNTKTIKIQSLELSTFIPESISEDIQHVGYDEEQCGRTK